MREGNLSFFSPIVVGLWLLVCLPSGCLAQDPLPEQPEPDHNSVQATSKEAQFLLHTIPVGNSMPASFRDARENCIEDPSGVLDPFWEKLCKMERAIRIVHIGDSHVRGHVFPYVMRTDLEEDFGKEAVVDSRVTYQTSGIAQETGDAGIVYHIIGVNGTTFGTFTTDERVKEIVALNPDLVIVSFGTNEAHARRYSSAEHTQCMEQLISRLKQGCPNAAFLLTTPPGAYVRVSRRRKAVNTRTPQVVDTERKFAASHGMAVWDLYDIVGGSAAACRNWTAAGMYQADKIHFTHEGYALQGNLFHEAFIKAFNDYVAIRLDKDRN